MYVWADPSCASCGGYPLCRNGLQSWLYCHSITLRRYVDYQWNCFILEGDEVCNSSNLCSCCSPIRRLLDDIDATFLQYMLAVENLVPNSEVLSRVLKQIFFKCVCLYSWFGKSNIHCLVFDDTEQNSNQQVSHPYIE